MDKKKSIVNYADDEEEDQSTNSSSAKECDNDNTANLHSPVDAADWNKSDKKRHTSRKERTRDIESDGRSKESKRKEPHHSSHHHHSRHHHSRSSKERHHRSRDHHQSNSPNHRRRIRSRSHSPNSSHESYYRTGQEKSGSSRQHSPKQRSRNCRKSKKDRSRSRSKESRSNRRSCRSRSRSAEKRSFVQGRDMSGKHSANATKSIEKASDNVPIAEAKANVPASGPSLVSEQKNSTIPKFYNTKSVNPSRIATQEEKRKLLWGDTKKDKPSNSTTNVWTNLKFEGESFRTEKFRKLMGIKSNDDESASCDSAKSSDISSTQEKLFQNLDMQYSMARMSTHTHRGVGLGFGTNNRLL